MAIDPTLLPTNIDATYGDAGDPSVKAHQEYHDAIHAVVKDLAATGTVRLTGTQTIAGTKTFSTMPVIPDGGVAKVKLSTAVQASLDAADAASSSLESILDRLAVLEGGITPPVAAFIPSATSGVAPFTVDFVDASAGTPTSWNWDFGDGSADATTQNPSHTYTAAGTYTVTLTATNAGGSDTSTAEITANTATGTGSVSTIASTSTGSASAVTAVSLTTPAGIATNDLMVAVINADNAPTMSAAPSGWTLDPSTPLTAAGGQTMWVYYKIATASEPGPYAWTLSTAQKWNGGITIFRGVDTTTPWDTAAQVVTYDVATTSVIAPSITTVTPNGMAVNIVGVNSPGADVSSASGSGFTEQWEADGGQTARLSTKPLTTAGVQGQTVANLTIAQTAVGWVRAIRRSGANPPTGGIKVTWEPPALDSNFIEFRASTTERLINMDPTRDYRIIMPSTPVVIDNDFQLIGGKNISLIGGEVRCKVAGRHMFITRQPSAAAANNRTIHVEGLKLSCNPGIQMTEGINIDLRDETGVTVQLQNIDITSPLYGVQTPGPHADILQMWNGPRYLKIDRLRGSSNYQGFMVQPGKFGADASYSGWIFKRILTEMRLPASGPAGYVLFVDTSDTQIVPTITITDWQVYGNGAQADRLSFNRASTGIAIDTPVAADFPVAGVGYVSPGYL